MPQLKFDEVGERFYETGTRKGVLYKYNTTSKLYDAGYAWNGLTSVSENPSGAEASKLYADDIHYLTMTSAEEYGLTIEAYSSPEEFDECDGTAEIATGVFMGQQERKMFGFSWQTRLGNDTSGNDYGYKIHLAYGCKASPSQKQYQTINDSPEAMTLSWEVTTTPVDVANYKPTAVITIDSTKIDSAKLTQLNNILYGTDGSEGSEGTVARLPLPDEIIRIMTGNNNSVVTPVTDPDPLDPDGE